MSRPSVMPSAEVEVLAVQRRRRYSAEERHRMVQETYQPGMSLSEVARAHGISPDNGRHTDIGDCGRYCVGSAAITARRR
jgi:hypothetical protein